MAALSALPRTFYGSAHSGGVCSPAEPRLGLFTPSTSSWGLLLSLLAQGVAPLVLLNWGLFFFFFIDKFGWVFSFRWWWCVALGAWGRFVIGRIPRVGIKFH